MTLIIKSADGKRRKMWVARTRLGFNKRQREEIQRWRMELRGRSK